MKTKILVIAIASALSTTAMADWANPSSHLSGHADATSFSEVSSFSDSTVTGNGYVKNGTEIGAGNESGAGSIGQVTVGQTRTTQDVDTDLTSTYNLYQTPIGFTGNIHTTGDVRTEGDVDSTVISNLKGVEGDVWSYSIGGTSSLSGQEITGDASGITSGVADQNGHGDASFAGKYKISAPTVNSPE